MGYFVEVRILLAQWNMFVYYRFIIGLLKGSVYTQCLPKQLTHLSLDKMAATFTDNILKCIFLKENITILIQFSLKIVPMGPVDNMPALV